MQASTPKKMRRFLFSVSRAIVLGIAQTKDLVRKSVYFLAVNLEFLRLKICVHASFVSQQQQLIA